MILTHSSILTFTLIVSVLVSFALASSPEVTISTDLGPIRGTVEKGAYMKFLGVPFIEPPVGPLRFSKPVVHKSWTEAVNTTEYTAGCPQRCELPPRTCPTKYSEDCIYLTVYAPLRQKGQSGGSLPVVAFIPGGHFEQGSNQVELYDGEYMVSRGNFILVTIGYRLGALGWMANVDLGLNGNLGLLDQREGLKWIQRNIAQFGGDPDNVVIAGQSAGAVSVCAHLISKYSKGLFHKAHIMSNPLVIPMRTSENASAYGRRFASELGCSSMECIRNSKLEDIVDAQYAAEKFVNKSAPLIAFMEMTVSIDGDDITQNALDAFMNGQVSDVPLMIGSVAEEALIFIMQAIKKELSTTEYIAFLTAIFYPRGAIAEVLYQYPPDPWFGDKRPAVALMGTDYIFFCPWRYGMAHTVSAGERKNGIYVYEFNESLPESVWGPHYAYCTGHVCHGSDLAYWFSSLRTANVTITPEQDALMLLMTDYMANFAYTGNPSKGHADVPQWPEFTADNLATMELQSSGSSVQSNLHPKCNFWDHIGKPYPYHFGIETVQKALAMISEKQERRD